MRSAELEQSQGGSTCDFQQLRSRYSSVLFLVFGPAAWKAVTFTLRHRRHHIYWSSLSCATDSPPPRRRGQSSFPDRASTRNSSFVYEAGLYLISVPDARRESRISVQDLPIYPVHVWSHLPLAPIQFCLLHRPSRWITFRAHNIPVSINVSPPRSKSGRTATNLMVSDSLCQYRVLEKKASGETSFAAGNAESSALHV